MVGDENVRLVLISFLAGKIDDLVPKTHAEEHGVAPKSYKFIGVLIMSFIKR